LYKTNQVLPPLMAEVVAMEEEILRDNIGVPVTLKNGATVHRKGPVTVATFRLKRLRRGDPVLFDRLVRATKEGDGALSQPPAELAPYLEADGKIQALYRDVILSGVEVIDAQTTWIENPIK
jgi:hypothetical protein